jgi:hypothetical protein
MGFSTILDILGSTVVGGLLFLILLRLNDASAKNTYNYGGELITQQNLVEVVQLIEHDFRKIGFCKNWEKIPDPSQAILSADSSSITFLTDVDSDENVDTLKYFLGSANDLTATPNSRDKLLYRVVNNETPGGSNLGVTQFKLIYYDALGNQLVTPVATAGAINTMQINITIENTVAYDNEYSTSFWRQIRLAARNLRNR